MQNNTQIMLSAEQNKKLFWTGVAVSLVCLKLLLSIFIPGLRTPGELVIGAIILLACSIQIFSIYSYGRKQPKSQA